MEFQVANIKEIHTIENVNWNYMELKQQILDAMVEYQGIVVTDENYKECKAKKTKLNKFRNALETARKGIKKEINKPYEKFAQELADVLSPVEKEIANLDSQIKAIDNKKAVKEETPPEDIVIKMSITTAQLSKLVKFLETEEIKYERVSL